MANGSNGWKMSTQILITLISMANLGLTGWALLTIHEVSVDAAADRARTAERMVAIKERLDEALHQIEVYHRRDRGTGTNGGN